MACRMEAVVLIVCGLWLQPEVASAQPQPTIRTMADDAQMSIVVRQCKGSFDVNEEAADTLFQAILSTMFDEYGEENTEAALDAALDRIVNDVKARGLDEWCLLTAFRLKAHYPEVLEE